MSKTRNNHYVPEWYQKDFWEAGKTTLAYLDLAPEQFIRSDGSKGFKNSLHEAPPSRAFVKRDLYSTFFGTTVNDEIERKLFGDVDTRGAPAVRAFAKGNPTECHENFMAFFEYIDTQKLRTPKGLAWLQSQYPFLSQNELMMEMQALRMMHCTIWTEGVREIVSASESETKFIFSDHPVTVFNQAAHPGSKLCSEIIDPGIELKGTQTLFPLDRDHCLILTNLEYAQDPDCDPMQKRTFAGRFRNTMVRTDAFIRSRALTSAEVEAVNQIIRSRALRYVAAGKKEWLPEPVTGSKQWKAARQVLLPPSDELFHFGGETFVKFESGEVVYQDEFGRGEKEREFLKVEPPKGKLRSGSRCGCGSGKTFGDCCKTKPDHLRPAWDQMSIRERNQALFRGIENILELRPDADWTNVRRTITDEKISKIYSVYEALWPLETDLLTLLPKPDGTSRAVYTGMLHPSKIAEAALGSSLLFDEILVQHPFVNARAMNEKFSPVKHPQAYRQEVLKCILMMFQLMPLIDVGLVNLFPDPWDFDYNLRDQTMRLAEERGQLLRPILEVDEEMRVFQEEEMKRSLFQISDEGQRAQIRRLSPESSDEEVEAVLSSLKAMKERDPYAVLQTEATLPGEEDGQLQMFKLAPNFEMSMYVAQATGATIVTDNVMRWNELKLAILARGKQEGHHLNDVAGVLEASPLPLLQNPIEVVEWWQNGMPQPHVTLLRKMFSYLSKVEHRGQKPNFEKHLLASCVKGHDVYMQAMEKTGYHRQNFLVECAFPEGGIYDSTINRLLLMSSSEHHMHSVPMALFLKKSGENL
ncbi:DUF4238 domain-containing protein [Cognatiyoonia sp. IB215182]|uniref:DUF4238 domain-containing protein n=1 Tax=Cognatiyoonia sp. IB215182 TaxID=3097353 RepID=UPI002A111E1C|nr:DUF4238 domain-containing protein [Cognatiyoonia sp. IB215182]MDX8355572.1 DUF4238 domain-containing protein [Cognatiyoonia sp. IB215182]